MMSQIVDKIDYQICLAKNYKVCKAKRDKP